MQSLENMGNFNGKGDTHVKKGKINIDEIREYFPELLEGDIKELEAEVMQLA